MGGTVETATDLMRMALALLDEAGEGLAAVLLQQAIELVDGELYPVPLRN